MSSWVVGELITSFRALSRQTKWFVLLVFCGSYLISCDYSIIRPVSSSLFISSFGADHLPYAWLFAVPFNFLLVSAYNYLLPRWGSEKIVMGTILGIIGINTASYFLLQSFPGFSFFFYIWKEVYILLMFQQLWSKIHATLDMSSAKFLYGVMYAMGALGAVCGSLASSMLALKIGSQSLLFATLPIYLLLCVVFQCLYRLKGMANVEPMENRSKSPIEGLRMIFRSKILFSILAVVVLMQAASTLTDFQFNTMLETHYPDMDMRTAIYARTVGWIQLFTLALQLIGTYLVIEFLGVHRGHIAIPLILMSTNLLFVFFPTFLMVSISYIAIKTLDFSLFSVLKEMLYLPLKLDEKYRAKAFIDIFAYRGSKSLASLFILLVQGVVSIFLIPVLSISNMVIFGIWIAAAYLFFKQHKKLAAEVL